MRKKTNLKTRILALATELRKNDRNCNRKVRPKMYYISKAAEKIFKKERQTISPFQSDSNNDYDIGFYLVFPYRYGPADT